MKDSYPKSEGLAGSVLAASPEMQDPNFHQTLVYIAEHDPHSALGLVMNRPVGQYLGDIAVGPNLSDELAQLPVYYGGPVRPHQLIIGLFEQGASEHDLVCRLDAPLEQAEARVMTGRGWVRAFLGYSGWGEGQLEEELKQTAWQVCRPDPALLDDKLSVGLWSFYISGDNRWRNLASRFPDDPELN